MARTLLPTVCDGLHSPQPSATPLRTTYSLGQWPWPRTFSCSVQITKAGLVFTVAVAQDWHEGLISVLRPGTDGGQVRGGKEPQGAHRPTLEGSHGDPLLEAGWQHIL